MNTNMGSAGKVLNASVLRRSGFYLKGEAQTLFPRNDIDLYGVSATTLILRNPAYLFLPWFMKPYSDVNGSEENRKKLIQFQAK